MSKDKPWDWSNPTEGADKIGTPLHDPTVVIKDEYNEISRRGPMMPEVTTEVVPVDYSNDKKRTPSVSRKPKDPAPKVWN